MVHLKKNRFPIGSCYKLKMKEFRPCKLLRKFESGNTFEVELLGDMNISPIFNMCDIF